MTADKDRFGNPIDPNVGYARGRILNGPVAESLRHKNAMRIVLERYKKFGSDSFYNFTGHRRRFNVSLSDLETALAEEYVGMSFATDQLDTVAREHLGGSANTSIALFNRASAGIISAILAAYQPSFNIFVSLTTP